MLIVNILASFLATTETCQTGCQEDSQNLTTLMKPGCEAQSYQRTLTPALSELLLDVLVLIISKREIHNHAVLMLSVVLT